MKFTVADLLDQLRGRGLQMAVVADEYGGTAGILTLEDVVEIPREVFDDLLTQFLRR
jgi:CBS domain containing-hemolysin-like protein